MKKKNILHKKLHVLSIELNVSPTSKSSPQIYNSACSMKWQVDNGLVNKLAYIVDDKRWDQGYPTDLDNA